MKKGILFCVCFNYKKKKYVYSEKHEWAGGKKRQLQNIEGNRFLKVYEKIFLKFTILQLDLECARSGRKISIYLSVPTNENRLLDRRRQRG